MIAFVLQPQKGGPFWGRQQQTYNRDRAGLLTSLLILVVIGLLVPALFDYTERRLAASPNASTLDEQLSLGVSVVLILLYIANLFYTLFTHRDVFAVHEEQQVAHWPAWKSLAILAGATIQVGLLIAPVRVIASYFTGHPMNLVFANPLELIAIAGVAFAVNAIAQDGEVTWFEGALLAGVYVLLAIAFFFVTPIS